MVTPDDGATDEVGESRQYTVENPVADTDHIIQLFDADNVSVDADGVVSFEERNEEAVRGDTDALITVANGTTTGDDDGSVIVQPTGGVITFNVESDTAESIIPVVYFDEDESGTLTVDEDGLPVDDEPFGIGGQKNWLPAEAESDFDNNGLVVQVNTEEGFYTLDTDATDLDGTGADGVADVLINYVSGDTFTYDSSTDFTNVDSTLEQFESWLSEGDFISINGYNPGGATFGADETDHVLENDVPNAPTGLTGQLTDGDIELDWTAPANPDVVQYQVEISTQDADGDFPDFATAPTGVDSTEAAATDGLVENGTEYTLENAPAGVHRFRVLAQNENVDASPASNVVEVTVAEGADETSPVIETITTDDNDTADEIDAGDQIALGFSEAVVVADGTVFELTDDDGTVGTVTLGGNATYTMSANNEFAFITLTADPVISVPGETLALDNNVEITDITEDGIQDEAGNDLDLPNSERLVLGTAFSTMTVTAAPDTAADGADIDSTVTALVLDANGDELEGVEVTFSVNAEAEGALTATTATTDVNGEAVVSYQSTDTEDDSSTVTVTGSAATVADDSDDIVVGG